MTKKRRISIDWFVWLQWAFASGLGGAVGFALADPVLHTFSDAPYRAMAEIVIFGPTRKNKTLPWSSGFSANVANGSKLLAPNSSICSMSKSWEPRPTSV